MFGVMINCQSDWVINLIQPMTANVKMLIDLIGDRLRTAQITVHDLGSKGLCLIYYSPSG